MNDTDADWPAGAVYRNQLQVCALAKRDASEQSNAAWAYVERLYRELPTGGIAEQCRECQDCRGTARPTSLVRDAFLGLDTVTEPGRQGACGVLDHIAYIGSRQVFHDL